jgi:hypothetical protein
MNWIKKPWSRIIKNDYFFKEDIGDNQQAIGGVDIINFKDSSQHAIWKIEFWGKYTYLQLMFVEKYSVEYETSEEASIIVDAFLDKIFDLKVFL